MSELHVKDNFRTNPLSLQPGGDTVKTIHQDGKIFVYDKVKRPGAYIKNISMYRFGPAVPEESLGKSKKRNHA